MSDGEDDARAEIRAAVRYLLEGAVASDRGDIVHEIIAIVSEVAHSLPPGGYDPLDDGMPVDRHRCEPRRVAPARL